MKVNSLDYLLPKTTTEIDSYSGWTEETDFLDFMALHIEHARCMKNGAYKQAADAVTKMIELAKNKPDGSDYQFHLLHAQRAACYAMAKDYDAALNDLTWLKSHSSLSTEYTADVQIGLIHLLQGKDAGVLQGPIAHGNALALLLLNEPENEMAPKTELYLLPVEIRIQKLVEGRHYAAAIEEMNKLEPYSNTENKWAALRGVCYALRGNYLQAIQDLKRADQGYFSNYSSELAVVYAMADQRDKALKVLKKPFNNELQVALVRQWIDKIAPAPLDPTCPVELIEAAKEKLIQFLKALNPQMDPEKLQFVEGYYHVWPDASLGHPVPGQVYPQVLTPGFVLEFKYENAHFYIHTDEKGNRYVLPSNVDLES